MAVSLAVIIVSYNTRELLQGCLDSLLESLRSGPDLQSSVWVVDNASGDDSAGMVAKLFPQVRLRKLDQNIGFVRANNLAMRELGLENLSTKAPDYVFLLNPDTETVDDAPHRLTRFLEANPKAGMAGPMLLYADGRLQHSAFAFPTLWQILLDFFPLHGRLLDSRLNGRYPIRWYRAGRAFEADLLLGAAMMVRSAAIREVGLLDERYFMYCEEIDWCMRFWKSAWPVYCVPAAEIVHHEGASTRQFRDEMFVALWRSRFLLFERWYPPLFISAARGLVRLGLRQAARQARHEAASGDMSVADLEGRLKTYQRVLALIW